MYKKMLLLRAVAKKFCYFEMNIVHDIAELLKYNKSLIRESRVE